MRFNFLRKLAERRKIIVTDAKTLDTINKDKIRFNFMRATLRDGHKPSTSELSAYHNLVKEFGRKSLDAGKTGNKLSEKHYDELAKNLNDEVMKALQREYQKLIPKG